MNEEQIPLVEMLAQVRDSVSAMPASERQVFDEARLEIISVVSRHGDAGRAALGLALMEFLQADSSSTITL